MLTVYNKLLYINKKAHVHRKMAKWHKEIIHKMYSYGQKMHKQISTSCIKKIKQTKKQNNNKTNRQIRTIIKYLWAYQNGKAHENKWYFDIPSRMKHCFMIVVWLHI